MKYKFIILMGCILILGCKKNPFDYRTKFIGNYIFNIKNTTHHYISGDTDTSYSSSGKIDFGPDKNTISISFSGLNSNQIFTIYEDGTIDGYGCKGEFESNCKINYSCFWGSPAVQTTQSVIGEKR